MKKFDRNQKIGLIACVVFVLFLVAFAILSSLVQSGVLLGFAANQRVQGILAFIMFLPLCAAMFFGGRHLRSKGSKTGGILIFISVALFAFGVLQALLSLLGAYGS